MYCSKLLKLLYFYQSIKIRYCMHKISEILNTVLKNEGSAFFYTPSIYENAKSYLFSGNFEEIKVTSSLNLMDALKQIDFNLESGKVGFGYITYEAGYYFEELPPVISSDSLLNFNFFESAENITAIDSHDIIIDLKVYSSSLINNFKLNLTKEEYIESIFRIKEQIEEGYTYQVNYTTKGRFNLSVGIPELFVSLLFQQSAEYISLINSSGNVIISFSPELFFDVELPENKITAKPMKGTVKRGKNFPEDQSLREWLNYSEKDRAENVMIVDLLRNDLGKICEFNSIKPSKKFEIKKYESLYQMVTTVTGRLNKKKFSDIIKALFPCGSITGAPKRKTMEIIASVEKESRGVYTGAIGMLLDNKWIFNVPIRTLNITEKNSEIGIGSGVVWDSIAENEYDEVLLKSNFLKYPVPEFRLIETMLIEDGKIFMENEHLSRIEATARFFLFLFPSAEFLQLLHKFKTGYPSGLYKLRVELDKYGKLYSEITAYTSVNNIGKIVISGERISSENKFLYFKTTNRKLYNDSYQLSITKGYDEIIFLNEKNELCEGAISNIVLKFGKQYVTPGLSSGLLPGTLRERLLKENIISERILTMRDIYNCDQIFLINSVYKIKMITKVERGDGTLFSDKPEAHDEFLKLKTLINNLK